MLGRDDADIFHHAGDARLVHRLIWRRFPEERRDQTENGLADPGVQLAAGRRCGRVSHFIDFFRYGGQTRRIDAALSDGIAWVYLDTCLVSNIFWRAVYPQQIHWASDDSGWNR